MYSFGKYDNDKRDSSKLWFNKSVNDCINVRQKKCLDKTVSDIRLTINNKKQIMTRWKIETS